MKRILAICISFLSPFVTFLSTIPSCVMGGVCISLYGFIAVSGLKMLQKVNLEENKNLFTASVILIAGIGGLTLTFGKVTITSIACALILGILTNVMLKSAKENERVAFKSYEIGQTDIINLLTAESQLADARDRVVNAFYTVLINKATLYRSIGRF